MRREDINQVVKNNMGLVFLMKSKLRFSPTIDLDDILQAGRLAIARCHQTFDPKKGKWSTHASNAIKYTLMSLIREDKEFREKHRTGKWMLYENCDPPTKWVAFREVDNKDEVQKILSLLPKRKRNIVVTWMNSDGYMGICKKYKLSRGSAKYLVDTILSELQNELLLPPGA
jgi:RNA polymerase sigma factor (sigma-70 family)